MFNMFSFDPTSALAFAIYAGVALTCITGAMMMIRKEDQPLKMIDSWLPPWPSFGLLALCGIVALFSVGYLYPTVKLADVLEAIAAGIGILVILLLVWCGFWHMIFRCVDPLVPKYRALRKLN